MNLHTFSIRWFAAIWLIWIFTCDALATGPRIKQDLFTRNPNAIYALDFPPFISTGEEDGGMIPALVAKVLAAEKLSAAISSQPLARMLKYYLFQEQALAVIANPIRFSPEQRKQLIFVPLLRLKKHYYVHQTKHPDGLPWSGDLQALTNEVYGANPEEDVDAYNKAGIDVQTSNLLSLLEKLKDGTIDFIGDAEPAVDYYLQRNLSADKAKFMRLEPAAGEETVYIIFNKQHPAAETIAKQFQAGLAALIADGQYQTLLEHYLGGKQAVERYTLPLQ